MGLIWLVEDLMTANLNRNKKKKQKFIVNEKKTVSHVACTKRHDFKIRFALKRNKYISIKL